MTSEYTALDRMRQSDGKDGRSPISELKLVKYNAFVDGDHIERAMQSQGRSFIRGPLVQENFSIMKYDVCLKWSTKKQWRKAQPGEETSLRVFSPLNGLGSPKDTRLTLLSCLTFAGFAGTGTREDSTGQSPYRALPVVVGGLYNTWNTGDLTIDAGDWVYWDLPEDNEEIEQIQGGKYNQGRPRGRFLAILRPYDPANQSMNFEMVRYAAVDLPSAGAGNSIGHPRVKGELIQWSVEYAESLREAMYQGALMAASGIFGAVPAPARVRGGATDDTWIQSMQSRMTGDGAFRAFAARASQDLRLAARPERAWRTRRGDRADPAMVANRLLLPTSNRDRIVKRTLTRRGAPPLKEPEAATDRVQKSVVVTNLRAGEEVRYFTKGRIVGKAQENVGPGDFFDIVVGSYAI